MFDIITTALLVIFAIGVAFVGAMTFTMEIQPVRINETEGFLQNK